jgi:hypothetical protein
VVAGTVIDSSDFNSTIDDIGADIADSLSRTGQGGMSVGLKGVDGSAAAPSFTFAAGTSTGLYRAATNDVRMSLGGTDYFRFKTGVRPSYWDGAAFVQMPTDTEMALKADLAGATFTGNITLASGSSVDMASGVTIVANGLTLSDVEISALDGIGATTVAAQLALKAPLAAPVFTGNLELPTTAKMTSKGGVIYMNSASHTGGAVLVSTSAASGTGYTNGDIWIEI